VARKLLDAGAEVNAECDKEYGSALQVAARNGEKMEGTVRLLLETGADVNTRGGYYGTAVQAAAVGPHETVVRLLLETGADVNAQGGRFGNALLASRLLEFL
jgi:ankyrin repeat protein